MGYSEFQLANLQISLSVAPVNYTFICCLVILHWFEKSLSLLQLKTWFSWLVTLDGILMDGLVLSFPRWQDSHCDAIAKVCRASFDFNWESIQRVEQHRGKKLFAGGLNTKSVQGILFHPHGKLNRVVCNAMSKVQTFEGQLNWCTMRSRGILFIAKGPFKNTKWCYKDAYCDLIDSVKVNTLFGNMTWKRA